MRRVGIRELRQNAAAVLREVRAAGRLEPRDPPAAVGDLVAATADDVTDDRRMAEAASALGFHVEA